MCGRPESKSTKKPLSEKVEDFIGGGFNWLGANYVGPKPKLMILLCILLAFIMGSGFAVLKSESRQEKLWVPQNTQAEQETNDFETLFPKDARFNTIIVKSAASSESKNILEKDVLVDAMKMHLEIETAKAKVEEEEYDLVDVCMPGGAGCMSGTNPVCFCLINSLLKYWNYDLETLQDDTDILSTLNNLGGREVLEGELGNPVFDDDTDELISAEAFTMSYFLKDRSEVKNGNELDPINEAWEEEVFLETANSASSDFPLIEVDYFATRSFSDEFGGEIQGDLLLVQISYVVSFLYLGANLGAFKCGSGSRWTMACKCLFCSSLD